MQTLPRNINPFALMLDPQSVIAQIERSGRLEGLHRRVCRPLDKPLLGGSADDAADEADPGAQRLVVPADDTSELAHARADNSAIALRGSGQQDD